MAISRADRAKQFLPFDALSGLQEALREKEKQTEDKIELSEDGLKELEEEFNKIQKGDIIKVKYYKDKRYIEFLGNITRIDTIKRTIELNNNKNVHISDILKMQKYN